MTDRLKSALALFDSKAHKAAPSTTVPVKQSAAATDDVEEPIPVGHLLKLVQRNVQRSFGVLRVQGEVSDFKPWRSGHWYFGLKDR